MASVQFYHLTTSPLERALPKLLETIISKGFRVAVVAESEERVAQLNQLLWTYDQNSFLPHGSAKDGNEKEQPIYLTTKPEAPNDANVMLITGGAVVEDTSGYERVADMFDGNDLSSLQAARLRWKHYKDAGLELSYMQQGEQGGWQQKAVA
ncbi:MAG: DNA polymerase III subunit chi [Rickettsiales bacterium]